MLLAGVGVGSSLATILFPDKAEDVKTWQHVTSGATSQKNFLVVDSKTENGAIESAFDSFTQERKDIALILINQHVISPIDISAWTTDLTSTTDSRPY